MAKEEHTACLKRSEGNRAKFKHNFSATDAFQPVGLHCALVRLLDDWSKKQKNTIQHFSFWGEGFQLAPSLCAIQYTGTQIHCHSTKVNPSDVKDANCFRIITAENIGPHFSCYCITDSLD